MCCRHVDDCWRSHDIARFDLASYNIQVPMETDNQDSRDSFQATSSNQQQRFKRTPRRPSQDRAWRERNKKEEEEIVRNLPQPVGYGNQAPRQSSSPTITQDQLEEFGNKIMFSAVAERLANPRNLQLERIRQEDMVQRYMNPVQNPMPHIPRRSRFNSMSAVNDQINNLNNHLQREERKRAHSLNKEFVHFQELPQDQRRM